MDRFTTFQGQTLRVTGLFFAVSIGAAIGQQAAPPPNSSATTLKQLSLEELSQIEVITPTKQAASAFRTAAAIYVITGEDIRRSGVTSIPDALRLAPGVEVARIDGKQMGRRNPRIRKPAFALCAGPDRWPDGLHAAFCRHLLGSSGHAAGGHRSHRSDPRSRRHHLGAERRQRRHQHHHEDHHGDPGDVYASVGGRQRGAGLRRISATAAATARDSPTAFTPRVSPADPNIISIGDNFDDWRGVQSGFRMDWTK